MLIYGSFVESIEYLISHLVAAIALAGFADLLGLELLLVLVVWLAARKLPSFGETSFARVEAAASRFAVRKVAAPLALAGVVILVRLLILPFDPVPHPVLADEFSHLLLADTFAHGRLTNPPHPQWRHFEALHIIQQPTYNSMYFPGPALMFLVAQVITGLPWIGLLVANGVLCGLICWALQCWFPPRWALLGGALTALHIAVGSYWMDSYWGGTFPAIGATLVLGAFERLRQRKSHGWPSTGLALLVAAGIAMLANSRPYEGVMFCIPVAVRLAFWLFGPGSFSPKLIRCMLPMALVLLVVGAGMATYFQAVTGSPMKLPYVANQERYGWPLTLPWTDARFVKHDRQEFTEYFLYEMSEREYFLSLTQYLGGFFIKVQMDWRFFIGPALMIPCLFLGRTFRKPRLRFLMLVGAVGIFAAYLEPHFPHYLAPVLVPVAAVWVEGFRHLRQGIGNQRQLGLRLSRAIPVVLFAAIAFRVGASEVGLLYQPIGGYTSWCCTVEGAIDQEAIARKLPPGRHLMVVRYNHKHRFLHDWIRNAADIDGAPVVWARELGGLDDVQLLQYYWQRQIWLFEPDQEPPRLTPYPLPHLVSKNYPGKR